MLERGGWSARVPVRRPVATSISLYHSRAPALPVTTIRQELWEAAVKCRLQPPLEPPGRQPNTEVRFELYDAKSFPATASPLNASVWEALLRGCPGDLSQNLQGMILYGAKIAYDPQGSLRRELRRSETNLLMDDGGRDHVDKEVRRRIKSGELRLAGDTEHLVTSPVGAVPKPSVAGERKYRTIHHLSYPRSSTRRESVNDGIDGHLVSLRYYDLDEMLRELGAATRSDPGNTAGRALWKVDLKDAYRHVVVEQGDARLLGYFWPGVGYVYETQLSFGGRSAPFIFNLVAEGFEWILRSFGLDCHHYLDDSFGWVDQGRKAQEVADFVRKTASALGLTVAAHKTVTGPEVEVLGIVIDCDKGTAFISDDKRVRLVRQIEQLGESATLLEIQSLAGSLVFVTKVCVIGKAFLRRLFDQVRICQDRPTRRWRVTLDTKRELKWWKETFSGPLPIRHLADDPAFMSQLHVWSDASGTLGIGGHLEAEKDEFSERIPQKHESKTILFKEALAVLRCVELWARKMLRRQVVFHVDNQALVAALNKGSCDHRPTQALIRKVYTWAAWNSFAIRAVWLSSEENARADRLSRFMTRDPAPPHVHDVENLDFDPDAAHDDHDNGEPFGCYDDCLDHHEPFDLLHQPI